MADSPDPAGWTELSPREFESSWLWRRTSPTEYFGRDARQALLDGDEEWPDLAAEFRRQLAAERATLTAAWHDGDELWEWRNENWASQKVHATDTTGETGIAVIRGGRVIAVWVTGVWT